MVFGQILKNVLDKNQSVWIPTVGLLSYDKAGSKLGLDVYGSGTDSDLIHLISEIKQVGAGEAKGILIQEVESLKSAAINQGKYTIEGLGDILFSNGGFQFESKKTLFPTNFFGGGNFNPAAFKDNATKEESNIFENAFIKVAPPKSEPVKVETSKAETLPVEPVVQATMVDAPQIIEPEVKTFTQEDSNSFSETAQPKDLFEAAEIDDKQKIESKSILDSVKDFFGSSTKKVEETVSETTDNIEETVNEWVSNAEKKLENITEDIQPEISLANEPEVKEEDFASRILNEISQEQEIEEEEDKVEDILDEEEEEELIEEAIAPIIERPKKIVIDEPRSNIGYSRYDDGFYDYDLTIEEEKKNRWPLVAGLSAAILLGGFLVAWSIASFQGKPLLGLNPLWKTDKKDVKPIEPKLTVKLDSTAVDSLKQIASAAITDSLKNDSLKKIASPAPTNVTQATSVKAATPAPATPSKTPSTQPTQTITKNTSTPKTPNSADPVSKKPVAVATEKTKKSDVVTSAKEAASISVSKETTKKEKDTSAKLAKAKVEKVNLIGKPYATANYTKGNHYLSFGKFKIASAAVKLKSDMKKKAGIETDIILLDGTYRVVVPYLSRDKAEAASRDYVSTTLFE